MQTAATLPTTSLEAPRETATRYFPWVHRAAVLTVICTFILIALGGIVTSLDVGMAVPDWPTTFGHSMFGYPLSEMVESMGVFYEHSHRLAGSVVGMLAILTVILTWAFRGVPTRWRWLAFTALVMVSIQGLVGGLRVLENDRAIAVFHALGAQLVLSVLVCLAVLTSRRWVQQDVEHTEGVGRLRILVLLSIGTLLIHLYAGAGLRHQQAQLAGHLWLAGAVTLLLLALIQHVFTRFRENPVLMKHAKRLVSLLGLQLGLGFGTWAFKFGPAAGSSLVEVHAALATAHLFVGAAILATTVAVALEAHWKLEPREAVA